MNNHKIPTIFKRHTWPVFIKRYNRIALFTPKPTAAAGLCKRHHQYRHYQYYPFHITFYLLVFIFLQVFYSDLTSSFFVAVPSGVWIRTR